MHLFANGLFLKEKELFMSKFVLFSIVSAFCFGVNASEGPLQTPDNTQSVLTSKVESSEGVATVCKGPNCVIYKGKNNIAPCAVPTQVGVCMTETGCNACCQKVTTRTPVSVEICAPSCPSKQKVRTYKNGSRVVYDYGRYEAVVTGNNGVVEVRYRKRLFNR